MTFRLIIIFILSMSVFAKSVKTLNVQNIPLSKITITKKEKIHAGYIDKLQHIVSKNELSKKLSKKVFSITKTNSLFKPYNAWAKEVKSLNIFKTPYSHLKRCKVIQGDLKRYCINTFLKKFKKRKISSDLSKNHNLFKKFAKRTYLKRAIAYQNKSSRKKLRSLFFKKRSRKLSRRVFKKKIKNISKLLEKELNVEKEVLEVLNKFNTPRFENRLIVLAKDLTQKSKFKLSRKVLNTIKRELSQKTATIHFEYLWAYIQEKDYRNGLKYYTSNSEVKKSIDSLNDQKINFWLAFLYEKNNSKSRSLKIYSSIINEHPLSYYAIMSSKELSRIKGISFKDAYLANLSNSNIEQNIILKVTKEEALDLKRVKIWSRFENLNLQSKATKIYLSKNMPNRYLKLAAIHHSEQNHLETFKATYKGINNKEIIVNRKSLNFLYPYKYLKPIKKYSKSIDPFVALSLIRQESAFNKRARSVVGARGLMQIMPRTGRIFHKRLKKKQLYDPYLNLKIGTRYLERLVKRYDKNLVHALSAYNAGESRVKRWKRDLFNDDSIYHNIERIPFTETRKYVKLIFRNIFFYKFLEEKKEANRELASYNQNYLYDVYLGQ